MRDYFCCLGGLFLSALTIFVNGQVTDNYVVGTPINLTYPIIPDAMMVNVSLLYRVGSSNNSWELGSYNNTGEIFIIPNLRGTTEQLRIPYHTTGQFIISGGNETFESNPPISIHQPLRFENITRYTAPKNKTYASIVQIQPEFALRITDIVWEAAIITISSNGESWSDNANASAKGIELTTTTTAMPTIAMPTTAMPTTARPTRFTPSPTAKTPTVPPTVPPTLVPTAPTTAKPTRVNPPTETPTSSAPTSVTPTTVTPTSASPTTAPPTSATPTTAAPTTTTAAPTTAAPTTASPTRLPPPTTAAPTTAAPTTTAPTTAAPTTAAPTTPPPTTAAPTTTVAPTTTAAPTTAAPTTASPTRLPPPTTTAPTAPPTTAPPTTALPTTTAAPTTASPTTASPTTASPTTAAPTTPPPTTAAPTTAAPTTASPTTAAPTTAAPTTPPPTTAAPTTAAPTTATPTTATPTTAAPTTAAPTTPPPTAAPTTAAPTTAAPTTATPTTATPTTATPTTAAPTIPPTPLTIPTTSGPTTPPTPAPPTPRRPADQKRRLLPKIELLPRVLEIESNFSNLYEVSVDMPATMVGTYDLSVGFTAKIEIEKDVFETMTFYTVLGAPNLDTPILLYDPETISISFEPEIFMTYDPIKMTVEVGDQYIPLTVGLTPMEGEGEVSFIGCSPPYQASDYNTFGWLSNKAPAVFASGNYSTDLYWYPPNVNVNKLHMYALTGKEEFPTVEISKGGDDAFMVHSIITLPIGGEADLNITTPFNKSTILQYHFIQQSGSTTTFNSSYKTFEYDSTQPYNVIKISVPNEGLSTSQDTRTLIQFVAKDCNNNTVFTNEFDATVTENSGSSSSGGSSGLSTGAIIGIVAGGVVLLIVVGYGIWRYIKYRRESREPSGYAEIAETE